MQQSDTSEELLTIHLLKMGLWLQTELDRLFLQHELTRQQYNVLRILRGAPSYRLMVIQLRDRLLENQPDITRLLDRMVLKGLISKIRDRVDKRKWHVQLESSGLKKCSDLDEIVANWNRKTFACMSESSRSQMIKTLAQFFEIHFKEKS